MISPHNSVAVMCVVVDAFAIFVNILQRNKCKSLPWNALYERECSEN